MGHSWLKRMEEAFEIILKGTVLFLKTFQSSFGLYWMVQYKQIFPIPPSPHMHSLCHYQNPHQSGPLVTTVKPTLTCHNHPKSTVYLRIYFWCYIIHRFRQIEKDIYPPLQNQSIFTALEILCATLIYFSPPLFLIFILSSWFFLFQNII